MDIESIDDLFPFDSYRPKQRETMMAAMEKLFLDDYDNLIIDAPTGVGKSAINVALARSQESAYYVTPQKSLREQLLADSVLSKHYNGLKGRRDYTCGVTGNNCKECKINQDPELSCRDYNQCNYWSAKEKAMYSDIAILTFAYLIVDGNIPEYVHGNDGNERLSFQDERELVIVDECHSLEQQVASLFAGFKISPWILPAEVYEGLLTHVSMDDVDIHTDVRAELEELYDRCEAYIAEYGEAEEMQNEVQDCKKMHTKLEWLFTEVDEYDRAWVVNMEKTKFSGRWQKVMEMKPVHVDHFLKNFVWSRGKKRILSTATMPYRDKPEFWCTRIGLDPDRTHVIHVGMPFPKENRPIHTKSMIAEMSNGGDKKHWPEIMAKLDELSNFHTNQKGLIHTASYNRAKKVYESAKTGKWGNLKGNVVLHEGDHDADDVIAKWQNSNQDLLVTPSMTEGVDLDGDKCRWQALIKVPFPYPGDSRVNYLLNEQPEIGWPWYWETTANQIIQSAGRAVRSRDDYANYYVLDESFKKVQSKVAFPEWFEEAIDVGPAQRAKNSPIGW